MLGIRAVWGLTLLIFVFCWIWKMIIIIINNHNIFNKVRMLTVSGKYYHE